MSPKSSLSYSAAVILQAVANNYQYGFDIMDMTGLPSGTVYPALRRMEELALSNRSGNLKVLPRMRAGHRENIMWLLRLE